MFLNTTKVAVIVLFGFGAGFLLHRGHAEPPKLAAAPAVAKTPEEMTALLKARVALAEKCYTAAFEGLSQTRRVGNVLVQLTPNPEDVYLWSARWLQAQKDSSPKHEDHIAALEAHLQRMTKLKKVVEELSKDLTPRSKVNETEWYRLEAELWLTKAKAKK